MIEHNLIKIVTSDNISVTTQPMGLGVALSDTYIIDTSKCIDNVTQFQYVGSVSALTTSFTITHRNDSGFSNSDLKRLNKIVYNFQDTLPHTVIFEKVKKYEHRFNLKSEDFHTKWELGELPATPEFYDWNNSYKTLNLNVSK